MTSTTLRRFNFTPEITGWRSGNTGSVMAPLVLLHGVGLMADSWKRLLPHLTEHFSVYALNLPGHGESEPFPADYHPNLSDYSQRIIGALHSIDEPVILVGHSMGALIALDIAIERPELVSGVIAMNAIFQRSDEARNAVVKRAETLSRIKRTDPKPTLDRWFPSPQDGETNIMREDCREWLVTVDPVAYGKAYTVFAHEDGPSTAGLANLVCPALFITGALEPNSTPAMSQNMTNIAPNGRCVIVENARHMMPMTHAGEVAAAVTDFSRTLSKR